MTNIERNGGTNQIEKSIELSQIREIILENFSWVKDRNGVVINAGSTIGGSVGHDVDIVVMLNAIEPEEIVPDFVQSIESMENVIERSDQIRPTFSFSRVAWQDFMSEIKKTKAPDRGEPLGIHFLWYSCPEQLFVSEPRGLALGLLNGEILLGNSSLAVNAKTCCPDDDKCRLWRGLDNVLDPIRLIANPSMDKSKIFSTIGHTIERFIVWDILAERIRQKRGFDLVTRDDVKQELNNADNLIKSVLDRSRKTRDEPSMVNRSDILTLGKDIIKNWRNIRRLK